MKAKSVILIAVAIGAAYGIWSFLRGSAEQATEIEFRYAKAEQGELVRSISANGQLVALTTVDVKSKAGGKVVKLAVEEGSAVKKGDLIAVIDPEDTTAIYEQAVADVESARARSDQARINAALQRKNQATSVEDAKIALDLAKIRLAKAEETAKTQPTLTTASIRSADANYQAQKDALSQLETVTIPQMRRESETSLSRTKADFEAAEADYKRQSELLGLGYVAQATVDSAKSRLESSRAAYEIARQRASTLEREIASTLSAQRFRVEQAKASFDQARANQTQDSLAQKSLDEARRAVRQAEISLQRAKDEALTVDVRQADIKTAKASAVRSEVSMRNAKVQLDSTTVLAPRDGVVTLKYLEEGTIIPPGTSTFAQGTSLVQISDTTTLFIECAVDEADIGNVEKGQPVRITVEAYPGLRVRGEVDRVNPAATTVSNVTAVKVRVKVVRGGDGQLLPGMNATCEFITLQKHDVLTVPAQAIKREGEKTFVKVKGPNPKSPKQVDVKVGETGNDLVEVLSGLKAGDEVVVAEIDLKQMREIQQKMIDSQQGGGLAGGSMPGQRRPGQGSTGRMTGGGSAGGGGGGGRSGGGTGR